jgi:hypothetical protein
LSSAATKLRCVEGRGRQASKGICDLLRDDGAELPGRFTYEEVGENRTRRDGDDAPLGLKASRGDTLAVEPYGQPQNVTAHWIGDLDGDAGVA